MNRFKMLLLAALLPVLALSLLACQDDPGVTWPSDTIFTTPTTVPTTAPTEPTEPTEPQPTEPQPTEPQPTEPQPTEPQPTEPQPTEPQPTEPQPTEPQPTEPPQPHEHSFGAWVLIQYQSCTHNEVQARFCICGEVEVETVNEATGHSFGSWEVTQVGGCLHDRIETQTCHCGLEESRVTEYAPGDHDYDETGLCLRCGEKVSPGLEYILNQDGSGYLVSGLGSCTDTQIRVPQRYQGHPVTGVAAGAFTAGEMISIFLPEGVGSIGSGAFRDCSKLVSVDLPDTLQSIGWGAFQNCKDLAGIILPESLQTIEGMAFAGCTSLRQLTLPMNVVQLGAGAVEGCTSMTKILVDENNPAFLSLDGVVFHKDKTVLVAYPCGKTAQSYMVPAGVVSMGDYSLSGGRFTTLVIQAGVTAIGDRAFYNCKNLTTITLSHELTQLGREVFLGAGSLRQIHYSGTVEQWNAIVKTPGWDAGLEQVLTIYCVNGQVVLEPPAPTPEPSLPEEFPLPEEE